MTVYLAIYGLQQRNPPKRTEPDMNLATLADPASRQHDCPAGVLAIKAGEVVVDTAISALEAWLQAPVRPILDGYLGAVLSRVSLVSAATFRRRSF
ncbi:hypothetical protein BWP39_16350 [Paraburkholderia acidicola]|uniref:Uncharacterized protein n=2 Tax=Paraburkholderia acidicola TaxID=1912599 RepID=A0A2A4EZ07_9BURK|nr:hypothetical protein BWP39_16350 [Paraburkholderia acidicola]